MDLLTSESRSEQMRRVKSKDTAPELAIRRLCRELGRTGYRLHPKALPGRPDIAFIGRKQAIFVNGCFWHGHNCKGRGPRLPKSRVDYWAPKIARNMARDSKNLAALAALHWNVLTIYECELRNIAKVREELQDFLALQE